jgi:hypothetical protein
MTINENLPNSDETTTSYEFLADCLQRISDGDPMATHDLANFWMAHMFDRDPVIELGIVEGLMRQSANLGSEQAKEFMSEMWPNMRPILEKRLRKLKK